MTIKAIVFAEEDYEETLEFDTQAEADAFGRGASYGAGKYGAGHGIDVLTLDDLRTLDPNDKWDAKRIAWIREHLNPDESSP